MKKDFSGTVYLKKILSDKHIAWIYENSSDWNSMFQGGNSFNFNIKNSELSHYSEARLSKDMLGIINMFIIRKTTDNIKSGNYLFGINTDDVCILGTVFMEHKRSSFITSVLYANIGGDYLDYADIFSDSIDSSNFLVFMDRCKETESLIRVLSHKLNEYCGVESEYEPTKLPKNIELDYDYTQYGDFDLHHVLGSTIGEDISLEYLYRVTGDYMINSVSEVEGDKTLYLFHSVGINIVKHEVTPRRDISYFIFNYRNLVLAFICVLDGKYNQLAIGVIGLYKNLTHMSYLGCYDTKNFTSDYKFELDKFLTDLFNK